jgi:RimJ/RimL family protein N-acetyltransferase
VLEFSFQQLAVHRVYATVDTENAASIRVLEKLGMRREGLLVRSFRSHVEWRDHYLYAIVEDEWASPR